MSSVTLRPVSEADLPFLFEQQRDAEAHRMAAFTGRDADDEEAFMAHWRRILANPVVLRKAGFVATGRARAFARARGEETWEISMVLE